jgi:hypothetical protein
MTMSSIINKVVNSAGLKKETRKCQGKLRKRLPHKALSRNWKGMKSCSREHQIRGSHRTQESRWKGMIQEERMGASKDGLGLQMTWDSGSDWDTRI